MPKSVPASDSSQSLRGCGVRCKGIAAALTLTAALAACAEPGAPPTTAAGQGGAQSAGGKTKIGLLLPLSGRNARLGREMANAAQLAVPATRPGAVLDIQDTDASGGAAAAARGAIGNGDRIILGPLTATQTAQVSDLAASAGIPELAYTSDVRRARDGVWVMGLTPQQQVSRLVAAAHAQGKSHFAAFLPDTAFGHVLGESLVEACLANGLSAPTVAFHSSDAANIADGLKSLSDFTARQAQAAPAEVASTEPDAVNPVAMAAEQASAQAAGQSAAMPPPPFDALLLGDTGLQLAHVINALKSNSVDAGQVRILAPALWGAFASKLGALHGAWFAAPDPAARSGFAQQYRQHYGSNPTPMTDIAYDTSAMAAALASQPDGLSESSLMRADGFAGVDGVFALKPGGHVARALAIFEIQPSGGARIVQPSPRSLTDRPS